MKTPACAAAVLLVTFLLVAAPCDPAVPHIAASPAVFSTEENSARLPAMQKIGNFTVTAYDLSVESCGKPIGHPAYGITANNKNLSGKSWQSARSIAVDPEVIPLGSKVYVKFSDPRFSHYDGIFAAEDTGSAVKGKKIDLFHGDYRQDEAHHDTIAFGNRKAEVWLIVN